MATGSKTDQPVQVNVWTSGSKSQSAQVWVSGVVGGYRIGTQSSLGATAFARVYINPSGTEGPASSGQAQTSEAAYWLLHQTDGAAIGVRNKGSLAVDASGNITIGKEASATITLNCGHNGSAALCSTFYVADHAHTATPGSGGLITAGGGESLEETLAIGNTSGNYDIKMYGGYDVIWYSDAGSTEKARIDGATGTVTTEGYIQTKNMFQFKDYDISLKIFSDDYFAARNKADSAYKSFHLQDLKAFGMVEAANIFRFTAYDIDIKVMSDTYCAVRNKADTAYKSWYVNDLKATGYLYTSVDILTDNASGILRARPTAANTSMYLRLQPLGTATTSTLQLGGSSDTSNFGYMSLGCTGTTASIGSALYGTGTAPTTLDIADSDWDTINLGDASAVVSVQGGNASFGASAFILKRETQLYSGADLIGYSDAGTTEKWRIDGATGNITTVGTVDGVDVSGLPTNPLSADFKIYSGYDLLLYSDAGSTLKAAIYGDTGRGSFGRAIGSVGIPTLEVYGTASGTSCASIQEVLSSDNYPSLQIMSYAHDDLHVHFDAYYDGSWRSSDAGSNYAIYKLSDLLGIRGATGVGVGGVITWTTLWQMSTTQNICYKDLRLYSGADLIVFSDAGSTEKARIDGATGNITTVGTVDGVDVSTLGPTFPLQYGKDKLIFRDSFGTWSSGEHLDCVWLDVGYEIYSTTQEYSETNTSTYYLSTFDSASLEVFHAYDYASVGQHHISFPRIYTPAAQLRFRWRRKSPVLGSNKLLRGHIIYIYGVFFDTTDGQYEYGYICQLSPEVRTDDTHGSMYLKAENPLATKETWSYTTDTWYDMCFEMVSNKGAAGALTGQFRASFQASGGGTSWTTSWGSWYDPYWTDGTTNRYQFCGFEGVMFAVNNTSYESTYYIDELEILVTDMTLS